MTSLILPGPMVRAVLQGTKTQHRVPLKKQPWGSVETLEIVRHPFCNSALEGTPAEGHGVPERDVLGCFDHWMNLVLTQELPYPVGSKIWVKEKWAPHDDAPEGVVYLEPPNWAPKDCPPVDSWRSAGSMPRWASRLTLEVTSVRVERLQEISEEDANSEGMMDCCLYEQDEPESVNAGSPPVAQPGYWYRVNFESDWNSRFKKRPELQWDRNPWVFVLGIKQVKET